MDLPEHPELPDPRIPPDLRPGEPVLVSACLLGEKVRWDGEASLDPPLVHALRAAGAFLVPVCPELFGGLGVPRPAAEPPRGAGPDVLAGRVPVLAVEDGRDLSAAFLEGARRTVAMARACGARHAFLKERSPSCGVRASHSGGGLVAGPGVTAAALAEAGVAVHPGGQDTVPSGGSLEPPPAEPPAQP